MNSLKGKNLKFLKKKSDVDHFIKTASQHIKTIYLFRITDFYADNYKVFFAWQIVKNVRYNFL